MEINPGDFFNHSEFGVGKVLRVIDGPEPEVEILYKDRAPTIQTVYLLLRNASRVSQQDSTPSHLSILNQPTKRLLKTRRRCDPGSPAGLCGI